MNYTNLSDFTVEYTVDDYYGMRIQIEKAGGGTPGRTYAGMWRYVVTRVSDGSEVARGQDFVSPIAHTHEWVALEIGDYFADDRATHFTE